MYRAGRGRLERGFTLLELMMVLVIIGVIASMAVLSIGGDPLRDQVETEGRRLAAMIQFHREAALLRLEERGLVVAKGGYQVLVRESGEWVPLVGGNLPEEVTLPDGLLLDLSVEELPAQLKENPAAEGDSASAGAAPVVPQVWLSSSGDALPFELVVRDLDERHRFSIVVDANGRLSTRFESEAG